MVYVRNRVYYWRYRGLTSIVRQFYDIVISSGLPSQPEASRMGNPGEEGCFP